MFGALALVTLLSADPHAWRKLSDDDGFTLEAQDVDGSSFETLRVTCSTKATPEGFITALWGKAKDSSASPEVVQRDVFVDEARERLYHDVIRTPIVSDRDFVMHEVITVSDDGTWTMKFDNVSDKRAPEKDGIVRMPKCLGTVAASPAPQGAKIVYTVFTDVGGAVPAVLTRGSQRKAAVTWLKEIRRRAEEKKAP
jgi:hypothetical protein